MKLNGYTLGGYSARADEASFSLDGCTIEEAAALDGETLTVTTDEGEAVEVFEGYALASVAVSGESVRVRAIRKVEESAEAAIHALEENVRIVRETATATQAVANEAKQTAEGASGSTVQLASLATVQVATMDLSEATSTDCVGFRDYWPEWRPDTEYKYQQPLRHKGLYYRASKALTSSEVYPPDTAGESEYYPVEVAPDGVIVYRTCHGQYDQVQAGETRHYPDADGPIYRAKVDTAYDPDTVPGNWELV